MQSLSCHRTGSGQKIASRHNSVYSCTKAGIRAVRFSRTSLHLHLQPDHVSAAQSLQRTRFTPVLASSSHPRAAAASGNDTSQKPKARLAVFVSGGGSNFKAIHEAVLDGRIHADIAVRSPPHAHALRSHGTCSLMFETSHFTIGRVPAEMRRSAPLCTCTEASWYMFPDILSHPCSDPGRPNSCNIHGEIPPMHTH